MHNMCIVYSGGMNIEFEQRKAASNLKKHGVSFDEAATSLLDPMALVREDNDTLDEVGPLILEAFGASNWLRRFVATQRRIREC